MEATTPSASAFFARVTSQTLPERDSELDELLKKHELQRSQASRQFDALNKARGVAI